MVCDFTPCAPGQRCYVTRGPSSRHLLFGLKGGTWSKVLWSVVWVWLNLGVV